MKSMLSELFSSILLLVGFMSLMRVIGLIDWTWGAIFMPIWLTAMIAVFLFSVIVAHDTLSTPEEREKARARRHHRNWGL